MLSIGFLQLGNLLSDFGYVGFDLLVRRHALLEICFNLSIACGAGWPGVPGSHYVFAASPTKYCSARWCARCASHLPKACETLPQCCVAACAGSWVSCLTNVPIASVGLPELGGDACSLLDGGGNGVGDGPGPLATTNWSSRKATRRSPGWSNASA